MTGENHQMAAENQTKGKAQEADERHEVAREKVDLMTRGRDSAVDWGAIIAGSVLAAALSFVLLTFGAGLGLSLSSPGSGEDISVLSFVMSAGVWLLAVQLVSFMAGGYLAGRLRMPAGNATSEEVDLRDGSHGLMVWAIGTLLGAVLLASGLAGAAQTAASALGSTAENVASATSRLMPEDADAAYLADTLLRDGTGATSEEGGQAADGASGGTATANLRQIVTRVVERAIATGELPDVDRQYLAGVVAEATGLDQGRVEERIGRLVEQTTELRAEAVAQAEAARQWSVMAAFLTAAALLISAAGAYLAATYAGRQRDAGIPIPRWYPADA
jgi:hypothetical protein